MQKQKRNSGQKHFLNLKKSSSFVEKIECEGSDNAGQKICSVFVIWPRQDSLTGEGNGQGSEFPAGETPRLSDPGTISNEESPPSKPQTPENAETSSPTSSHKGNRGLLHPDHAHPMTHRPPQITDRRCSLQDTSVNIGFVPSFSSSGASSTTSVPIGTTSWASDPLHDRRSSTSRYSLLDALDLEYALMRATTRGSISPCSLSQSLQKLSFTQSLAFPALARGLDDKRSRSERSPRIDPLDSGVTAFAKVVTALLLVFVSVLVFGVVYKFVRT